MDDIRIDIDPDLDEKVYKLPETKASAKEVATEIASEARDAAPVLTGAYRDGIKVEDTKHGARVVATDPKSALIEFGVPSHGEAPQFVLRRATEQAGYGFKKQH